MYWQLVKSPGSSSWPRAPSCRDMFRLFQKLKVIKSYLLSSITQNKLKSLLILSIENPLVNKIVVESAMKLFEDLKDIKMF